MLLHAYKLKIKFQLEEEGIVFIMWRLDKGNGQERET